MTISQINFAGSSITVRSDESLLDAFLRQSIEVPFSCRGGSCHNCLLQCTDGEVPARAQRGLPSELSAQGYLLACQCHPVGPMALRLPDALDRVTPCVLHEARQSAQFIYLRFETARELRCKPGQVLVLSALDQAGFELEITRYWPESHMIEALFAFTDAILFPDWMLENELGHEFSVHGPVEKNAVANTEERSEPGTDPELWSELDDGRRVRAVLEDFYRQVYDDAVLSPFFHHVTIDRSIDKQYSFLRQLMTGERIYFGDRPRNAHHWMVISEEMFDHRQALMVRTLEAHGLNDEQIARWTRLELHYRPDIVKRTAWPKRINGADLPLNGYGEQVLTVGSVCDHCNNAVKEGTKVRYHLRLGLISCPSCAHVASTAENSA